MNGKLKRELDFDFVVARSLSECQYRLGRLQEIRDIPFAPIVQIRQQAQKSDSIAFIITETQPADIVLSGYMTYLEAEKTFIGGQVWLQQYSRWEAWPPTLILVVLWPILGTGFTIGGLALWWWFVRRYQRGAAREAARLVRLLKATMAY